MNLTGEHRVRVRYGETDQMGVVYHANYLQYMDDGRTMLLAELGFDYAQLEREGVGLAVRRADLRYRRPARYGDVIDVRTSVTRVGGASITFAYELSADSVLLTTGTIELACLDLTRAERPPRLLPAELRAVLESEDASA